MEVLPSIYSYGQISAWQMMAVSQIIMRRWKRPDSTELVSRARDGRRADAQYGDVERGAGGAVA